MYKNYKAKPLIHFNILLKQDRGTKSAMTYYYYLFSNSFALSYTIESIFHNVRYKNHQICLLGLLGDIFEKNQLRILYYE